MKDFITVINLVISAYIGAYICVRRYKTGEVN